MKFIYITCNISMLEKVETLLHEQEVKVYQVIPKALAESNYDLPHKDSAVWPGYNACLLVQEADVERATRLIEEVGVLNEQAQNNGELLSLYQWEVEAYIPAAPVVPLFQSSLPQED